MVGLFGQKGRSGPQLATMPNEAPASAHNRRNRFTAPMMCGIRHRGQADVRVGPTRGRARRAEKWPTAPRVLPDRRSVVIFLRPHVAPWLTPAGSPPTLKLRAWRSFRPPDNGFFNPTSRCTDFRGAHFDL